MKRCVVLIGLILLTALMQPHFSLCHFKTQSPVAISGQSSEIASPYRARNDMLSRAFEELPLSAQDSEDIIAVTLRSSVDKFQPGTEHRMALDIRIESPYHINSMNPAGEFMIPTTVSLAGSKGTVFGRLEFPSPLLKTLSFSETPLEVYEGRLRIFTTVTLPESFNEKEVEISGRIQYQACDDKACLPPDDFAFRQAFPVAARGETVTAINTDIFAGAKDKAAETDSTRGRDVGPEEGAFTATLEERGLFLSFILVFLGGLALNLTPCVYPLIPITVSYFGGQAQGRKGRIVTHAFLYILGMAVTYSALGVVAALTGSLFGGAMQNPVVLIGVAAVMVALALSMFNLYEFRLPYFLTRLSGKSQRGYLGTLLMGLTVGIVAAPCIGPFVLGLLTYVGGRGEVLLGFSMFFILALGLGLPFLFLAIFSGSLDRLPRSGAWMVWVRTIFGFILLGMAVYFLRPLFPNTLAYHLSLTLIMLVGGIYLAWIEPSKIGGKFFPVLRQAVGILFFIGALIFAFQGIQGYVQESLQKAVLPSAAEDKGERIQWVPYSELKIGEAVGQGRPLLLDFYADWCIPCKELDKLTFSQPEVVEMSRKFTMLKVDLTSSRNLEANRLKKKFQIKGVPTLVLLNPDGSEAEDLRVVGFIKKEKLLSYMEKALPATQK